MGKDAGGDGGQPLPPDEPERIAEALNFPLGLASGDLESNRGVLWTRYAGMATLRLRVSSMMEGRPFPPTLFVGPGAYNVSGSERSRAEFEAFQVRTDITNLTQCGDEL